MQSQRQQEQMNKFMNKGLKYLINENLINISSLFNQVKQQAKKQTIATDSNELNTNLPKITTNRATSNNNNTNMVRLNWPQTRRQLSLLFVTSFIMIIISILSSSSNAEHALSEVWSESDGLQMKYSTDHEDLLSTKGSELQLNIHNKPTESGGSGEESAATSGGTSGNQEGSSPSSDSEGESNGTPTTSSGGSDHASDGSSGQSNTIPTSSSTSNNDDTESSSNTSNDDSSDRGGSSSSSSSGEDSADSTSSQNRVPLSKQQHHHHHSSSSSYNRQHQSSRFSEPSARFKTNLGQRDDSLSNHDEVARATRYKSESDAFNSIPSSNPFGNENGNTNNNNNDDAGSIPDQVNVDSGAGDDLPSAQASQEMLAGKAFRQVGRMFKEAVKMGNSDKAKSSHKSGGKSGNKDMNSNENEENDEENSNNNNEQVNHSEKQQQDDDAPSSASQEPDYNQFKSSANSLKMAGSPRARQNMIDFDRMVDNKAMMMNQQQQQQQQTALQHQQQQGELPDEISNVDGGGEEEESGPISNDDYRRSLAAQNRVPQIGRQQVQQLMNSPPDDFAMFQPNSAHNSNPFFASGSSLEKKERVAPVTGKQVSSNLKQHTTNNKPLAYFKGLSQQQKQASEDARRGAQMNGNRQQVTQQQQQPESPDNVRDNFISPGHFPGSMPHLTQAASETQKKEAEVPASSQQPAMAAAATTVSTTNSASSTASSSSSSSSSSDQSPAIPLASSDPTISVASSTSVVSLTSPSNVVAESSQQQEQQQKSSDTKQPEIGTGGRAEPSPPVELSRERDLQIHVTPVPEIQPESQQIMAPVYFSTTTMAPLPSTSATPTSGSGNKATTTSSEPPTLKRFKFRKYRR